MHGRILIAALVTVAIAACGTDDRPADTGPGDGALFDTVGMDATTPEPALTGLDDLRAEATLRDADGTTVGQATLSESGGMVRISLNIEGLEPGERGLHFHEHGRCDPPDFQTAGDHFAPENNQHGFENPQGPHAGDLENIVIGADGRANQEFTTDLVTLGDGPNSLFDGDGTSLMLHAAPDDYRTDPSGDSGARVACGVVTRT